MPTISVEYIYGGLAFLGAVGLVVLWLRSRRDKSYQSPLASLGREKK